ncbi:uroporphyrinogen-III synthase [Comamonas sp. NoAH]|uniref:uroporphyrinogen-III synthase n=1 Tax=Comamonas halotolerans TaxID=3041496 RepID=UPI0024E16C8A|nr:uroporphyrinogen-III synthase [Comamonas sp. NoAH]
MPELVVTRPQPDASLWVQQLQSAGQAACAVPMMFIGPSQSAEALAAVHAALQRLGSYQAIMFVSGNAVRYFFTQLRNQSLMPAHHTQFWSPGPGTTKALLAEGIPLPNIVQPAQDAPQFDSESLWAQAQHHIHVGDKILIVRGGDGSNAVGHGRPWMTTQLQQHGVQVDFAPVYERQAPRATPALLEHIASLRDRQAVWLFSSSECVQHLVQCNTQWSWHSHAALATHPRIAQQAREAGFQRVIETLPTVQSITASIKSLHDHP